MIPNDSSLCYIGQDSFQSGKLAARLLNYSLRDGQTVLILNLDKSTTNAQHLIDKELGFRTYFQQETSKAVSLISEGFEEFAQADLMKAFLQQQLTEVAELGGIFVTNSRAHLVIAALSDILTPPTVVGFDLIEPNLQALRSGQIKFLINQNPEAQGYLGVMTLFQHLIRQVEVPKVQYLPLDIVVKENERYYPNMQLLPTVL
jgi:LacI family transcriptional regulator